MESIRVNNEDLISVGRAAKILGITRMTLYRWIKISKVKAIKLGNISFIHVKEVDRLKAKATVEKP